MLQNVVFHCVSKRLSSFKAHTSLQMPVMCRSNSALTISSTLYTIIEIGNKEHKDYFGFYIMQRRLHKLSMAMKGDYTLATNHTFMRVSSVITSLNSEPHMLQWKCYPAMEFQVFSTLQYIWKDQALSNCRKNGPFLLSDCWSWQSMKAHSMSVRTT